MLIQENLKLKDSDGLPLGEDSTRKSNKLRLAKSKEREMISKKRRELLKV